MSTGVFPPLGTPVGFWGTLGGIYERSEIHETPLGTSFLFTYSTHQPVYPTYHLSTICLRTHPPTYIHTLPPINPPVSQLTYTPTHPLTYQPQLTHPSTHSVRI